MKNVDSNNKKKKTNTACYENDKLQTQMEEVAADAFFLHFAHNPCNGPNDYPKGKREDRK